MSDVKQVTPLTPEEKETLADALYAGELRDLAHLRGVRAVYPPCPDLAYEGDIKF